MASVRCEFLDDEQDLMWEILIELADKLKTDKIKPPKRNEDGKWHVYIESKNHKNATKIARITRIGKE